MIDLRKYPRTAHLQGSRLQPGDEDVAQVPFAEIAGRYVVVEEKMDGANAGLRFDSTGRLYLQSGGHFLTGGHRERHFALFKTWAAAHQHTLFQRLGDRYVVFGEWLYAKHTVFYDQLPHYFLEFDVLDLADDVFQSTDRRRALLEGLPLVPVAVLWEGLPSRPSDLTSWLGPSLFKSAQWQGALEQASRQSGQSPERVARETDASDLMEGLYLKVEEGGIVTARLKFIRPSFLTTVLQSESHWLDRPIVQNGLADAVDLFAVRA